MLDALHDVQAGGVDPHAGAHRRAHADLSEIEALDALRNDLIEVVSRYFEVDHATLSMDVQRNRESWALMVNLPLRRARSAS